MRQVVKQVEQRRQTDEEMQRESTQFSRRFQDSSRDAYHRQRPFQKRPGLTFPRDGPYAADVDAPVTMKTVGRRRPSTGGLEAADSLLRLVVELRRGKPFIPRGVYRFHSHEEKDQWILKMLSR